MKNPWLVEDISAFLYYNCPQCTYRSQETQVFEEHAISKHPLSLEFFKDKGCHQDPEEQSIK